MKLNRKVAAGIGIALSIGAVFWMRELASWRPVTVAKVGFMPSRMRISRDGRLLLNDHKGAAILNIKSGVVDYAPERIRDFIENQSLETYPRVWLDGPRWQPVFSAQPHQKVVLAAVKSLSAFAVLRYPTPDSGVHVAWSKVRREVYGESSGQLYIWDWNTGQLKKSLRYSASPPIVSTLSPDGRWLLYEEEYGLADAGNNLMLYDVKSGKRVASVGSRAEVSSFGFSPDGRFVWSVTSPQTGTSISAKTFNVYRVADGEIRWNTSCGNPVKWLPDGRIGIVQENGFSWRDETGKETQHLPGPFQHGFGTSQDVRDWTLSPDGNWIYNCELDGTIRKWRAK